MNSNFLSGGTPCKERQDRVLVWLFPKVTRSLPQSAKNNPTLILIYQRDTTMILLHVIVIPPAL